MKKNQKKGKKSQNGKQKTPLELIIEGGVLNSAGKHVAALAVLEECRQMERAKNGGVVPDKWAIMYNALIHACAGAGEVRNKTN
jgi:hypothetical protein